MISRFTVSFGCWDDLCSFWLSFWDFGLWIPVDLFDGVKPSKGQDYVSLLFFSCFNDRDRGSLKKKKLASV